MLNPFKRRRQAKLAPSYVNYPFGTVGGTQSRRRRPLLAEMLSLCQVLTFSYTAPVTLIVHDADADHVRFLKRKS